MSRLCDKNLVAAIQAFADEKYEGDWRKVTVVEYRGIAAALARAER